MIARVFSIIVMALATVAIFLGYDFLVGFERGAILEDVGEAAADLLGYGDAGRPGARGALNEAALRPFSVWDLRYVIGLAGAFLVLTLANWIFVFVTARFTGPR